ncbi:hypothetical protein NSA53_05385 [Cellulosimicrobium cellulans]|uniref:hypothetical protein n=1 Tax=Cellulosimicrobium cellulans TaxID=1710 RepID=UPI002149FDF4|nr:hypothetical protein [Cellulosimicrobium cellulans]
MTTDDEQDYCDWCMGPLSKESRRRSSWLGLPTEDAWACDDCLQAGRYRVPPDGWNGPMEEWLARDEYVLEAADVLAIVNALDEVLHGPSAVGESEFPSRIGVSRASARQTLRRIGTPAS